jgi:hypothetical protein
MNFAVALSYQSSVARCGYADVAAGNLKVVIGGSPPVRGVGGSISILVSGIKIRVQVWTCGFRSFYLRVFRIALAGFGLCYLQVWACGFVVRNVQVWSCGIIRGLSWRREPVVLDSNAVGDGHAATTASVPGYFNETSVEEFFYEVVHALARLHATGAREFFVAGMRIGFDVECRECQKTEPLALRQGIIRDLRHALHELGVVGVLPQASNSVRRAPIESGAPRYRSCRGSYAEGFTCWSKSEI